MTTETTTPEAQETTNANGEASLAQAFYPDSDEAKKEIENQEPVDGDKDNQNDGEPSEEEGKKEGEDDKVDDKDDKKSDDSKRPIEYKLELPENSLLKKEDVERIESFAKKHGLSKDVAQEILDNEGERLANQNDQLRKTMQERNDQWYDELESDKEFGGDNFKENAEYAKRALDEFGSDQLKEDLKNSGLVNYPGLVRAFAKIGRAMANDKFVRTGHETAKEKTMEEIFYGKNE